MFTSVKHLEQHMGVDPTIGRFFVDRDVPADNSMWQGRLIYISSGNGFVSIPVYYDILYRLGLSLDVLLDEKHIVFMERLLHVAMLRERHQISKAEELESIRNMLSGRVHNDERYEKLNAYMDQERLLPLHGFGLPYTSLNRADLFLYILVDLPLTEEQWDKAVRYWYALLSSYLILDDLRDYADDKKDGDDNIVLDFGDGPGGFEKTIHFYMNNCAIMQEINPIEADCLLGYEEGMHKKMELNN